MARRSPDSRELRTKSEVMAALGGISAVCALTGSGYSATENWKRLPTFPSRYFLVMTFALHRIGRSAPPELWGQVTPADRRQALAAMIAVVRKQKAA
jgi:hypothetical protein